MYLYELFLILLYNFQTFSHNYTDDKVPYVALNISTFNYSSNSTIRRQRFQPQRNEFYDPNWGYEPYWLHGDYYFNITNTTFIDSKLNVSTLCGGPCPYMFTLYGVICARNNNMTHRTFKNYCELVDIDCNNRMKWTIIYRGDCHEALKPYPLWLPNAEADIHHRAKQYLEDFEKTYPKTLTLSAKQRIDAINTGKP